MKRHSALIALPTATLLALSLAACTDNPQNKTDDAKASGDEVTVTITDDSCEVSPAKFPSGKVSFKVSNNGTKPNEFEVLAENKLQIESEKENIGPGTTTTMTTALDEGTYYTACKPNMVGDFVGLAALTVTKGEKVEVDDDRKAAEDKAITNYTGYVKDQVGQLVDATEEFTDAYTSGDVEKARKLYPLAREHYERIEPTAESFGIKQAGDLDGALDARVQDLSADAGKKPNDPEVLKDWTGWHRIEADLFAKKSEGFAFKSDDDRKKVADQLNKDTKKLYDLVYGKVDGASGKFELKISDVATGASALLEEVALSKIGGEEETFSHTDLYDFHANVEGAEVAYGNVEKLVEAENPDLAKKVTTNLDAVKKQLKKYETGTDDDDNILYEDYSKVASVQKDAGEAPKDSDYTKEQKELSDAVNALSEPLSQVSGTVLQ
jgi:iron uptake system component EfeO